MEISVFDVAIPEDVRRPNCDMKHRKKIAGSLEFFRLQQVCKIEKTHYLANTTN